MPHQTLIEVFDAFGKPVFGLTSPYPVKRSASVGHGGDHFELYFIAGPAKSWIRIDVRLEEMKREVLIGNLVFNDALQGPLRFPLDLRVERREVAIPVDGEPQKFIAFVCRRLAVALARIDGRWVYVHTPKRALRQVALRREKPDQLRPFLKRMDKSLAEHREAADAARARLDAGESPDL